MWLLLALLLAAPLPAVKWAEAGGGAGNEDADGIGADGKGRLVVSGGVDDADNYDIFAVGYGKHGRARWTRRYGAGGDDQSFDNDVDPRGDAVLTDSFNLAVVKEDLKPSGFPTYEQVVQDVPAAAKVIVKLATPADSPPARKIGYYSDGAEHVALVTFSTSGRRLFMEADADEVLRTNVAKYLFTEPS